MASSGINGDTDARGSCSGDWRDRKQDGEGLDDDDFGAGRGYGNGSGGGDNGQDRSSGSGKFRGYHRGGRGGQFNKRRGFNGGSGNRRANGLNPKASRFDDDLSPSPPVLDMSPVEKASTNVYWEECEKKRAAMKEVPFVWEEPETDFHLEAAGLLREVS